MTRRQQLITQMRTALTQLTSPTHSELWGQVEFEIADTSFCFEHEDLDDEGVNYD